MRNLKLLRKTAGLSQNALAERFNLSQQSIQKYENGYAEPSINTLISLAKYFNVTVDYLIGNEDMDTGKLSADLNHSDTRPVTEVQEPTFYSGSYTTEERDIVHRYRTLTPQEQYAVYHLISDLSNKKPKK